MEEVEGNPGYYGSRFYLRPHYQLEGLTVSRRLVSKLPSVKGGAGWGDATAPLRAARRSPARMFNPQSHEERAYGR